MKMSYLSMEENDKYENIAKTARVAELHQTFPVGDYWMNLATRDYEI